MNRYAVPFRWPGTRAGDGRPVKQTILVDAPTAAAAIAIARRRALPTAVKRGHVRRLA